MAILAIFIGNGVTKQMYDGFRKPVQLKVRNSHISRKQNI